MLFMVNLELITVNLNIFCCVCVIKDFLKKPVQVANIIFQWNNGEQKIVSSKVPDP